MGNVKREMFGPPTNENLYVLASDYEACEKERDEAKECYANAWEDMREAQARVKELEVVAEKNENYEESLERGVEKAEARVAELEQCIESWKREELGWNAREKELVGALRDLYDVAPSTAPGDGVLVGAREKNDKAIARARAVLKGGKW